MCKVMIMSGVNNSNREKALEIVKEMGKEISTSNRDGLGYAAVDSEGKLFGERWLENSQAFTNPKEMLQFGDAIEGIGEYNSFGKLNLNDMTAITLHTRMATSAKGMINTHPFVYEGDDTSLIHNGVIDNDKDFKLQVSTCDSEAILQAYLLNEVNKNPAMVNEMSKMLYGYYAVGIFSRDANGNRILDVFKGNSASLVITYLYDLGIYIFTTSEVDINAVCRKLNVSVGKAHTVKEGNLIRIDPFTSKVILREKFTVQSRFKTSYYSGTNNAGYWGGSQSTKNETQSNIVDVSNAGAKERKVKHHEDMLEMMKLTPMLKEFSSSEVRDMGIASGWWGRE